MIVFIKDYKQFKKGKAYQMAPPFEAALVQRGYAKFTTFEEQGASKPKRKPKKKASKKDVPTSLLTDPVLSPDLKLIPPEAPKQDS